MKEIPDGSVDMVLTDPPYGTTECKWDSIIPLEPMWEQLKRIIKSNGVIVMTASQPFTTTLISSNMKMFKYELIWDKTFGMGQNAKKMPIKSHENICVFYSKLPNYNPQMTKKEHFRPPPKTSKTELMDLSSCKRDLAHLASGLKYPVSIKTMSSRAAECNPLHRIHPTQKPVALMEYLIKTYTNEGETVLDFTMGSGTTGVACIRNNRKFIGIEMDEVYFDIAYTRLLNEYLFEI
jgi:site-specific DNA-methyltransferase (adenine-specific)